MRALAILCFTTGVAHAGSNEISLGSDTQFLHSASANALTDQSMAGGHIAYTRRLGTPIVDVSGLELWVGGGIDSGGADGTLFQTMSTSIGTFTMFGVARARYPLIPYVHASARVTVGTSRASLDLTDQSGHTLSDSGWSALAGGALGLEVTSREENRYAIGLRFELGYTRVTGAALSPAADTPDNTLRLKMSQTAFGHLDLSGPLLSFSLISSF